MQDEVVILAEYDEEVHASLRIREVIRPDLVPPAFRDASGSVLRRLVQDWWYGRAIPMTREGYDEIRNVLGDKSPMTLVEESMGLSLSDQFWVDFGGGETSWDDVNLFDNEWDGQLGLLTAGWATLGVGRTSPDPNATTGGNLRKAWEIHDGRRVLLKAGSGPFCQEPFNEVIASRAYEAAMASDRYVTYDLLARGGKAYSVCDCMVSRDECLIPAYDVVKPAKRVGSESIWMRLLKCCGQLGVLDAEARLTEMLVFDYVLGNRDRHWNNFGFVYDARTMRPLRIAPIYDSGSSLWSDVLELSGPWYRYDPRPLMDAHMRRLWPEDQLRIFKDYSWFRPDDLAGIPEIVRNYLSMDPLVDEGRIDRIVGRVSSNLETVVGYAERAWESGLSERPSDRADVHNPSLSESAAALMGGEAMGRDGLSASPDVER